MKPDTGTPTAEAPAPKPGAPMETAVIARPCHAVTVSGEGAV
ncbi:hypothetical protein ACFVZH_32945 [Streptomyces sp. NPDC059534]